MTVSKVELVDASGTVINSTADIDTIAIVKITPTKFLKIYMKQTVLEAIVDNADTISISGTGKITNDTLQLDTIHDTSSKYNVFYVKSTKLAGANYDAVKDSIGKKLDIELNATNGDTSNLPEAGDYLVTVIIKKTDTGHYVAASSYAKFSKDGENSGLKLESEAGTPLYLKADLNEYGVVEVEKPNGDSDVITTSTLNSHISKINIGTAKYLDRFTNNALIGDAIKKYLHTYATQAGSYDISLLINSKATGDSFISGTNSVNMDVSKYKINKLANGSYGYNNIDYTIPQKAIQIHLEVQ